jgi:hypothetical protein
MANRISLSSRHSDAQRGLDKVYELLGRNLGVAYLHVVYRILPDHRLRVFHINGTTEAQKRRYRPQRWTDFAQANKHRQE